MIDKDREAAAKRVRKLMDDGAHRKLAFHTVQKELAAQGKPCSPASLYNWCKRFKVSTR